MKRTFSRRTPLLAWGAQCRRPPRQLWVEQLEPRQLLVADVVINEIMYHPALENNLEEFVELFNTGDSQADLIGWRLNRGVDFTIPDGTLLGPGQFLVIAADVATFQLTYGTSANVIGPWQGQLSNSGEDIELEDNTASQIDLVSYADQGDWAERRLVSESWEWSAQQRPDERDLHQCGRRRGKGPLQRRHTLSG